MTGSPPRFPGGPCEKVADRGTAVEYLQTFRLQLSLSLWVNTGAGAGGGGGGCVIVRGIESLSIVWKGIDST